MLSNTLRLNFCFLKMIQILHPRYHPKKMGHILKNKQKNKCVWTHEIIRLIIMEMKIKMKIRSDRSRFFKLYKWYQIAQSAANVKMICTDADTYVIVLSTMRSSRPDVFCKKGVLRNFTKFTGKRLCQSLFFNKVAEETHAQVFSYKFY